MSTSVERGQALCAESDLSFEHPWHTEIRASYVLLAPMHLLH